MKDIQKFSNSQNFFFICSKTCSENILQATILICSDTFVSAVWHAAALSDVWGESSGVTTICAVGLKYRNARQQTSIMERIYSSPKSSGLHFVTSNIILLESTRCLTLYVHTLTAPLGIYCLPIIIKIMYGIFIKIKKIYKKIIYFLTNLNILKMHII